MKNVIFTLQILSILLTFTSSSKAQHLFPKKLDNCVTGRLCLDCGKVKAGFEVEKFEILIQKLNVSNNFEGIGGQVQFQVLIDSVKNGCVLSHTSSSSDHPITKSIIDGLNNFEGWIPAIGEKGEKEPKTSITMVFTISEGKLSAEVKRVDITKFVLSFARPQDPDIYNKDYEYKNINLKKYKITVWNDKNSKIPDNFSDNLTIDKDNVVWYETSNCLVNFFDDKFTTFDSTNSLFMRNVHIRAMATDNKNRIWFYSAADGIYSYKDKQWTKYDFKKIGIDGCYKIINNPNTGELFFCADEGLLIYKEEKWNLISQENLKELPAKKVYFAKRDSKKRIWIGTFGGSFIIEENGKVTSLNDTESPLTGKCITGLVEDQKGNLYFSVYDYEDESGEYNRNEGIVIRYKNNTWKHFTSSNSGMPYNHVTGLVYDKYENALWISTDRAGIVRFDLKDGWENYHNLNSDIPTSYISDIKQSSDNSIYLSTRYGMVKIERIK